MKFQYVVEGIEMEPREIELTWSAGKICNVYHPEWRCFDWVIQEIDAKAVIGLTKDVIRVRGDNLLTAEAIFYPGKIPFLVITEDYPVFKPLEYKYTLFDKFLIWLNKKLGEKDDS